MYEMINKVETFIQAQFCPVDIIIIHSPHVEIIVLLQKRVK